MLKIDRIGEVDCRRVVAHGNRLDRLRAGDAEQGDEGGRHNGTAARSSGAGFGGTQKCQESTSEAGSRRRLRHDDHKFPE
jgi:hypothetical protein